MVEPRKKMSLTLQIMLAMGIGALVGVVLNQFSGVGWIDTYLISGLFHGEGRKGFSVQLQSAYTT